MPGFLVSLKQLSRDKERDPNAFAVAISELMCLDGVIKADLKYKDTLVSISRDEVPFVRTLQLAAPRMEVPSRIDLESPPEEAFSEGRPVGVEDEDQDWVPTLEAGDAPPREADASPSGFISSLIITGEFESIDKGSESKELRFVPREQTLANYFVVTAIEPELEFLEMVEYEVVGNISLDGQGSASIEVLSISPPGDALLRAGV